MKISNFNKFIDKKFHKTSESLGVFFFLLIFFYWDIENNYLNFVSLIPIIFIGQLLYFFEDLKKNFNKNYYYYYYFFIFLLIHQISIFFLYSEFFSGMNIIYFIYLIITMFVAIFSYDFVKKKFFNILSAFIFTFNISIFILLIFISKNINLTIDCYQGVISEVEFIFKESSHFALISVPVILAGLNFFFEKKTKFSKIFFTFNYIIFLIISLFNISNTFLLLLICFASWLLIKSANLKKRILLMALIIISISLTFGKKQCSGRFVDNAVNAMVSIKVDYFPDSISEKEVINTRTDKLSKKSDNLIVKIILSKLSPTVEKEKSNNFKTDSVEADSVETDSVETDSVEADSVETDSVETDSVETDSVETDSVEIDSVETDSNKTFGNTLYIGHSNNGLSYEVFITSLNIAISSLMENIFGVGINNYDKIFYKKILEIDTKHPQTKYLNSEDASNSFAKIIVEFGILGLFFYLWIFKNIININSINSFEIFLIVSIAGQSIRGVGYFNASFIFFVMLLYILKNKNDKKKYI